MDCVVPAAGLSSRMGSHKLLESFGGKPLINWAVTNALESCQRVIVVVGHDEAAVSSALPPHDRIEIVSNASFELGMLTSIAAGAAEVHTRHFFVAPGDMPFLHPALYVSVARAAGINPSHDVRAEESPKHRRATQVPLAWFPDYQGRIAHPVLISVDVVPALVRLIAESVATGQTPSSMRTFLSDFPTAMVPVDDDGSTVDIDTVETLMRYESRARENG